jgi:hypothetical protein
MCRLKLRYETLRRVAGTASLTQKKEKFRMAVAEGARGLSMFELWGRVLGVSPHHPVTPQCGDWIIWRAAWCRAAGLQQ